MVSFTSSSSSESLLVIQEFNSFLLVLPEIFLLDLVEFCFSSLSSAPATQMFMISKMGFPNSIAFLAFIFDFVVVRFTRQC